MVDWLCELEAGSATAPVAVPDGRPNHADIYCRKVEHLAIVPNNPGKCDKAPALAQ